MAISTSAINSEAGPQATPKATEAQACGSAPSTPRNQASRLSTPPRNRLHAPACTPSPSMNMGMSYVTPPPIPVTPQPSFDVPFRPALLLERENCPRLLHALKQQSLDLVMEALLDDPEAASTPFMDHNVEPPLCAAVRYCCGPEIVQALLLHGAVVDAADINNRTPLALLCGRTGHAQAVDWIFDTPNVSDGLADASLTALSNDLFRTMDDTRAHDRDITARIAQMLVDAGADAMTRGPQGQPSCREMAAAFGNHHLLSVFSGEVGVDSLPDRSKSPGTNPLLAVTSG